MTREDFIAANPIVDVLSHRGVHLIGQGNERTAKCPFHEDGSPSFGVNVAKGVWTCHAGCGGGSVIDLIARFDGITPADLLRRESKQDRPALTPPRPAAINGEKPVEVCSYPYHDANGKLVFEVVRYKPKTFRQRRIVDGKMVWGMEGVERVLYRLPEVLAASEVWICEGEKDADILRKLGLAGTCNVGGAGKWLEGYNESLRGKRVIICGDNDKPGREHVELVSDEISKFAAEVRIVQLPESFKDVFDFIAGTKDPLRELERMRDDAKPFVNGTHLPIVHIADIESAYSRYASAVKTDGFHLGAWLGWFRSQTRYLVPGEVVAILAGTGVGKTAILSNIAVAAGAIPTIFFELELPQELLFERMVALKTGHSCTNVESSYSTGDTVGRETLVKMYPKLFISTESRLTVESIERTISRASLVIGEKPRLILLDYIGLIKATGSSRYDRVSQIAEELKIMAKATQTIVIAASQISRKGPEDSADVRLSDGKDSGSIENSAGMVLGAWRDEEDKRIMHIRILKNTKGSPGQLVSCNYDGQTLRITQR